MAKDMQRSKVYDAEAAILGPKPLLVPHNDLQAFVDSITRSRWWGSREPERRSLNVQTVTRFTCGHTLGTGRVGHHIVELHTDRRTELQMLHALAHVLTINADPSHGYKFALAYLHLVKQYSPSLYEQLRAEYRTRNIKRSTKSPEARAAAQERSLATRFSDAGDRARQLLADLEAEDE